jgi:hypothetical protein
MRRLAVVYMILIVAACSPVRGCVESNFSIEPDSRLPLWFPLPLGVGRADVTVELRYWTNGDAEMEMANARGKPIKHVIGSSCWHPQTHYTANSDGTYTPPTGPEYVIVRVKGVIDVVEHDKRPGAFRMANDPDILQAAMDSMGRGECNHRP